MLNETRLVVTEFNAILRKKVEGLKGLSMNYLNLAHLITLNFKIAHLSQSFAPKIPSINLSLRAGALWLDFYEKLLTDDRKSLNPDYVMDGTHLNPCYVDLLETALQKHLNVST